MKQQPKLTCNTIITIVLLLILSTFTTTTLSQFNCAIGMDHDEYIPIHFRTPHTEMELNEESSYLMINLWQVARHLQRNHFVNVRFTIGQAIPYVNGKYQCDHNDPNVNGLEMVFCHGPKWNTTTPTADDVFPTPPNWSLGNAGWCNGDKGRYFNQKSQAIRLHTLKFPENEIATLANLVVQMLNVYFGECQQYKTCITSIKSNGQCGDGIVHDDEECENIPNLFTNDYFDGDADTFIPYNVGCDGSCKLSPTSVAMMINDYGQESWSVFKSVDRKGV